MHVKPSFRKRVPAKKMTRCNWNTDHAETSGKSSMGVLLDWLTTPGNYDRWRGGGETKSSLADEIVERLHAAGLQHRNVGQVCRKLQVMEGAYHEAAGRLDSAKRELRAAEKGTPAERNLNRVLQRHFRYFAMLHPIMKPVEKASEPKKRPRLSTRRKVPVRRASPPDLPVKKRKAKKVERFFTEEPEDQSWPFADEEQPMKRPLSPVRKRGKAVESISVIELEDEQEECRQEEAERPKKESFSSVEVVDLEKAHMELAVRKLEVQVARDRALVVRAQSRSELAEHGVSPDEIDRLLPLQL